MLAGSSGIGYTRAQAGGPQAGVGRPVPAVKLSF